MIRRHSNLISLTFLSVACLIAVREYNTTQKYFNRLQQYEVPACVQNEENATDPDVVSQEVDQSDFTAPSVVKLPDTDIVQARTLQVSKGDTVVSLLGEVGFCDDEIKFVSAILNKHLKNKKVKIGQTFAVNYKTANEMNPLTLVELEYNLGNDKLLVIKRNEQGEFVSSVETLKLIPKLRRVHGKIHTSFYSTALQSGAPGKIVKEAIANLAYVMNFQHGIKRGDSFEILYNEYVDRKGNVSKIGEIKYIGFMAGNTYHRIYRMEGPNGVARYFDAQGQSIARGLLQTPLDPRKMRITSKFGKNRLHPIKGFRRDHKGVDFGASTGTEIKAAGDGVVVKLGYYGDYGNYIKIRHGSGYETAYAHLSRYAKSLKAGSKVKQNQVIGYVGSTGSATGPHLHFEVIYRGSHVNPMGVKAMPSVKLVGADLKKFNSLKRDVETHLVGLAPAVLKTKTHLS